MQARLRLPIDEVVQVGMEPVRNPRVLFVYYTYTQQSRAVAESMADVLRDTHS